MYWNKVFLMIDIILFVNNIDKSNYINKKIVKVNSIVGWLSKSDALCDENWSSTSIMM